MKIDLAIHGVTKETILRACTNAGLKPPEATIQARKHSIGGVVWDALLNTQPAIAGALVGYLIAKGATIYEIVTGKSPKRVKGRLSRTKTSTAKPGTSKSRARTISKSRAKPASKKTTRSRKSKKK